MALLEYYNTGGTTYTSINDDDQKGQTFSRSVTGLISYTLTHVKILSRRINSPGIFKAAIQAVDDDGLPDGVDLASGTINGNNISTSDTWNTITFDSPITLDPDTTYAIVLTTPDEPPAAYIIIKYDATSPTYANGSFGANTLASGYIWVLTAYDLMFETYGTDLVFAPPAPSEDGSGNVTGVNNMVTLKRLVAAANSKIWYEDI